MLSNTADPFHRFISQINLFIWLRTNYDRKKSLYLIIVLIGSVNKIFYFILVYCAVKWFKNFTLPLNRLCTLIGLFMITVGTGGIKPCVTSFGGDQFELPRQEHHLAIYFSVLYMLLCMGSLIAKTVSPILRSEVHCFGDKDCYSLAFGAPGLIVLASIGESNEIK